MRIDLHSHSVYSPDSRLTPTELVKRAKAAGLDGLAVTDHNSLGGANMAFEYARDLTDFLVIRGLEVSAKEGHVLAYGVKEEVPRNLGTRETVERIEALGGVAVAAHPYRFWSGLGEPETLRGKFAAFEVQNARTLQGGNRRAKNLATLHEAGGTGGSDAHFLDEVGRAWTVFEDAHTEEGLLNQLWKKKTHGGGADRAVRGTLRYVPKAIGEWALRGFRRI